MKQEPGPEGARLKLRQVDQAERFSGSVDVLDTRAKHADIGMSPQPFHLSREALWHRNVVGIQKSNEFAASSSNSPVPGFRGAAVG
ncbi:hypothetical protein CfE428DRAFT_2783 [Chthoniobacter flavus Ellin428]|uniref:Uncharacterized protein n=1 Tax=Chthoniobacter flavus Ellin428 TaxID=497964 RepID=B4D1J5_9BACT|nr:hypothetical protein CfE428DRAFT_2783 [Chthoniobacter flavus Ellin428]